MMKKVNSVLSCKGSSMRTIVYFSLVEPEQQRVAGGPGNALACLFARFSGGVLLLLRGSLLITN